MAIAEILECLPKGGLYRPFLVPFLADCRNAFRIRAVLRATSFADSSVVADDRLPVPVFEKSGSGL
jgi:hypothetical protein